MVTIPVFDGASKADPEKFLRQFKRACMANGDRDEIAWLEMLPIHLDDEASWWYDAQSEEVKASWASLTKELLNEFQEKESYQALLGALNLMKQRTSANGAAAENVREFVTRLKEVRSRILRSLRKTSSTDGSTNLTPTSSAITVASIDALVLRTFIRGLIPPIQEIVSWKEPETLEAAISWAQRKESNLADMAQPDTITVSLPPTSSPPTSTLANRPTPLVQSSTQTDHATQSTVTKLAEEFRDLKLFLVQGQNFRNKSPAQERPTPQRSVQFVTCHGCGKKGHYKSDCPHNDNIRTPNGVGAASSGVKLAEVNLLEFVSSRINDPTPEVMMAKRDRPVLDIEPPIRKYHKRSKGRPTDTPSTSRRTDKRPRRRIGIEDMTISRGQQDYSIIADLGRQSANITMGQLIARCPSLRRELRQGVSTKRPTPATAEIRVTDSTREDMRSPQVEATIAGRDISGCLVDGGAAVNIISNWLLDDLGLTPTHSSPLRLKVADQRCVKSVGMLSKQPVSVQGVTVQVDFHILDVSEARGGYPIILGRPWLRKVRAVDYWEKGNMKIGPHTNRVNVKVIPERVREINSSPEDSSDEEYDSSWTSEYTTSDSEGETELDLYALDRLPGMMTDSMTHLEDDSITPCRREELLRLVQFGPTLLEEERLELQGLVLEYADLFVSRHQDLPAITLEEHHIELIPGAQPVRARQKRMAPEKMQILKNELDRLLEGGFIIQVHNTEWVSPVVIVPKKGGKWRVCVNYRALNQVTKKDRQPLPHIDELLDDVAGHAFYTFCDGYSGYHQVKIHKDDILKTTFTTPWGTFAYLRMPFGLCNAGGTFQRVQMKIFGPYIGRFIRVYLDDFAVFGDRHLHINHVRAAFKRLTEHGCSLSPEKCRLGFEEGPLLGHIVFSGGLRVDPDKVKRIQELDNPSNHAEVSTLWGIINYHNRFIENLAGVARPITILIRKNTPFVWTTDCCEALKHVKSCLANDPVMRYPNWGQAFIINPSASEVAVAAVLMQNDEAGRAHPLYYASRLLTNCETRYSPSEKLTASLLFACAKFRHYLLASPHPVMVQCETDDLKRAVQQTEPTGRAARFLAG